jgi:hypothetical protein
MRLNFLDRAGGPERLVCDAEVIFDEEGPLCGMKLVGFTLWRGADHDVHVTFPSRSFNIEGERRYFDYLRSADGAAESRRVKAWIIEQFRLARPETAQPDSPASRAS